MLLWWYIYIFHDKDLTMTNWITWLDETILKSKPSSPEVGVGARSYLLNDLLHHAEPSLLPPQQGLEGEIFGRL